MAEKPDFSDRHATAKITDFDAPHSGPTQTRATGDNSRALTALIDRKHIPLAIRSGTSIDDLCTDHQWKGIDMQRIPVVQDGEIFYLRLGHAVFWHRAAIRAHPLSRVAHRRARDTFEALFAIEFPDAEIEWVRNVFSTDGSADTLRSLDLRNELEGCASSRKCLPADECRHGESP